MKLSKQKRINRSIEFWVNALAESQSVEEVEIKLDLSNGRHQFMLANGVIKSVFSDICYRYDRKDPEFKIPRLVADVIAETDVFDKFLEYIVSWNFTHSFQNTYGFNRCEFTKRLYKSAMKAAATKLVNLGKTVYNLEYLMDENQTFSNFQV